MSNSKRRENGYGRVGEYGVEYWDQMSGSWLRVTVWKGDFEAAERFVENLKNLDFHARIIELEKAA